MNDIARTAAAHDVAFYDPQEGLKTIAVAEASEKLWTRAKNAEKLFTAIEAKLTAQAEYVVWRDGVVTPSQKSGGRISVRKSGLPEADPGAFIAHKWRKKFCSDGAIDEDKLGRVINEAQSRCLRVCEQQNANTIRGTEGTGEFERYTPQAYVEAARAALGEIDLDPASCIEAQGVIKAKAYFTAETDGLAREWLGRVFLNPPYHRELAPLFIDKLLEEVAAGRTTAAILLTNNSTDTAWFQKAALASAALCFPAGRINFWTPDGGDAVLPTQGQAFTYFGADKTRFVEVFDPIGLVVAPL
jgi:DNA N-6-adenine-methyltransferase (Dam)